jgi:hypothetical protein
MQFPIPTLGPPAALGEHTLPTKPLAMALFQFVFVVRKLCHCGQEQSMNISKPRVSGPVWVAILLALIVGLVSVYLTYHLHVTPPDSPFDAMPSTYSR